MQNAHHFLIHDDDSETNFSISSLPVKYACGYTFCDREDPSTRSQNSDKSKNSVSHQIENKEKNRSVSQLQSTSHQDQNNIYHQSSIRRHIKNLEQAYANHKIDLAYLEVQKLKKLCEKTHHRLNKTQKQLINKVQNEMNDVRCYQKIMRQQGWELKKQKKNLKVSTKIQEGTVGVLVQAYIDVQIQDFLAVLTQIDLMKEWMPFMESSSLEKIVTRNCRIGHCINNFPFIAKRQSFFQGIGYDRMEHNKTVFMYTRSLNNRKDLQQELKYQVKQTKDAIQLQYKYLIIEYFPQSPKSGTLKMGINVDMKLSIPMFILGPATQGFGVDFYTNILKRAKNFQGSEWQKNVQKNPQFYNFVQKRIQDYYK